MDSYVVLDSTLVERRYVTSVSLIAGETYKFKVEARNDVGYSSPSQEISIMAATFPDPPSAPQTIVSGDKIVVQWAAPYNGGTPLTAYKVEIKQSDGQYSEDLVNCDGSQSTIRQNKKCTIPFTALRATPFEIPWGSSIYARVLSVNVVGESAYSAVGNGAIILSIPSAPYNLENDALVSGKSEIKFDWYEPLETGGTTILDYRVYSDLGNPTGSFQILESNVPSATYTAVGLT
jgi:hypothetical protein